MPIGKRWSSLERAIKSAPIDDGVYEFGLSTNNGVKIIYIGKGESGQGIRGRILAHINGSVAGNQLLHNMIIRDGKSVVVRWEECDLLGSASRKERLLFRDFYNKNKDIPKCNSRNEMRKGGLGAFLDDLFG